jgi:hypothetical protein
MIAAHAVAAVAEVAQIDGTALWWTTTITGAVWIVVVGLGYIQGYGVLLRATRPGRPHST